MQPISIAARVIPGDYVDTVKQYEYENGRLNIEKKAYGLVDFTSDEAEGNTRFILVTTSLKALDEQLILEDYKGVKWLCVYLCVSRWTDCRGNSSGTISGGVE